ncbi:ATP-binding protein [Streptomyces sp. AV19]|uniref:ATP-binding protein n=1 Tax=Streptomyces sp. AV19 TaxID=2793068 RepID=UPI001F36E663|nr:ATP-binding protein [Streptomyces sp. AV19]MDG4532649.1 ATP-binding protein [Streptomyces sp. AV19]
MTAHPAATGVPAYTKSLPREAASARQARLLVAAVLHTWNLPGLLDTCALIVSELVTNAVEHTECRSLRVTVSRPHQGRVRVAVVDMSQQRPARRKPSPEDVRGRGLVVVSALADRWGADTLPWGKRVWADVHAPRPDGGDSR